LFRSSIHQPATAVVSRRTSKAVADGHHRKTAAQALGISLNSMSFHLKHSYEKMQVHSTAEAVAKGLREHLV